MKRSVAALAIPLVLAAGCASTAPKVKAAGIVVEKPWVRTTDGATNQTMTALFADLTNPTASDISLTSADCGSVAGKTEIHEMVKGEDGKMMMREAASGALVPKESHLHMKPGGYHVMLMMLKKELPVGDEVTCTLKFSDGATKEVKAPVKEFTEEEDHYHTPMPSADTEPKG
ncbi:MAG: copper chaperone PCu(A)C [Propionibacteriaceae bacterium]|nr:copper chaperone PCu(A)C [Propionibacteriaceae bacterium]